MFHSILEYDGLLLLLNVLLLEFVGLCDFSGSVTLVVFSSAYCTLSWIARLSPRTMYTMVPFLDILWPQKVPPYRTKESAVRTKEGTEWKSERFLLWRQHTQQSKTARTRAGMVRQSLSLECNATLCFDLIFSLWWESPQLAKNVHALWHHIPVRVHAFGASYDVWWLLFVVNWFVIKVGNRPSSHKMFTYGIAYPYTFGGIVMQYLYDGAFVLQQEQQRFGAYVSSSHLAAETRCTVNTYTRCR